MYIQLNWYNSWNSKSGIEFYGEQIYSPGGHIELRSYKFHLKLGAFLTFDEADNLSESIFPARNKYFEPIECEDIIVYDTIKLTDLSTKDGSFSIKKIKSFLLARHKKEYRDAQKRLNRKLCGAIPEPVIHSKDNELTVYFLEFTKESADYWSGPYEFNNKVGACYMLREKDLTGYGPIHLKDSFYNREVDSYDWSQEEKNHYFDCLSLREQHEHAKYVLKSCITPEQFEERLPYKIFMYGNDDTSYSKYFATEEERQKEIEYLLKMQPLCMTKDIFAREYVFTN
jgi:hypothetical protein